MAGENISDSARSIGNTCINILYNVKPGMKIHQDPSFLHPSSYTLWMKKKPLNTLRLLLKYIIFFHKKLDLNEL